MKGIKLHELRPDLVGFKMPEPPEPSINFKHGKVPLPDPKNLTKDEAIMALRSAYRQLTSTTSAMNNKGIANRLIAPALAFLEGTENGTEGF